MINVIDTGTDRGTHAKSRKGTIYATKKDYLHTGEKKKKGCGLCIKHI